MAKPDPRRDICPYPAIIRASVEQRVSHFAYGLLDTLV